MKHPITIKNHYGIHVLRDDLLDGGTKFVLMEGIVNKYPDAEEFVYASPVYGGFQIALTMYCEKAGKRATIFCAKRKHKHPHTLLCKAHGAKIVEVSPGYLSVVEHRAKAYCAKHSRAQKLEFGAASPENIAAITQRAKQVFRKMGGEPDEVWVAVGSGTILQGILGATSRAKVYGVQVGAELDFLPKSLYKNVEIIKYDAPFEEDNGLELEFPSTANYDRKAFEQCLLRHKKGNKVLFWNVL